MCVSACRDNEMTSLKMWRKQVTTATSNLHGAHGAALRGRPLTPFPAQVCLRSDDSMPALG